MDNAIIAFRIKKIREYRNYTQSYIACKLNIKQNTYSEIERGAKTIKPTRIEAIANALEVPVDALLNDQYELFNIDKKRSNIPPLEVIIKTLLEEVQHLRLQNDQLIKAIQNTKH